MTSFSLFARLSSWVRSVVHRTRLESEMDAELALHLEQRTADLVRRGSSPAEAARRARVELGPILVHKEQMRASLGLRWCDEVLADLRYALRLFRRNRGFTAIGAISLALAIGANTTIFSVAKQLLFDRLNVPHPEQLRLLRWTGDGNEAVQGMWGDFDANPHTGTRSSVFSYPVYAQLRAHNQVLQDLFAFKEDSMNATVQGVARRANVDMVSGNYFVALGEPVQLGRPILPGDDAASGSGFVAVISDGLWKREFGGSPSVLGRTITVNQVALTVVGVAPRGFTGFKGTMESPVLFVPLSLQPRLDPKGKVPLLTDTGTWWVNIMARAKPGVDDRTAQAALAVQLHAAVYATMPVQSGQTIPHLALVDGSRGLHVSEGTFRKPMYVLLALTGFVILLACANIANLLLARSAQRQREITVRLAVGAARRRIFRQLLTESLLLASMGGAGGLLLGYAGRNVLPALFVNPWEQDALHIPFDWRIFAFTALVTLLAGILFGVAPAWLASRAELSTTLKDTAAQATRRRKGLSGKVTVAFQIGLSTLLVVGAGLFLRSLVALNSVDVGFDSKHLLLFEIAPPETRYPAGADIALHHKLEQRMAAVPGVERVSVASMPYLADSMSNADFLPEGETFEQYKGRDQHETEYINVVGADFFQTIGIPIRAGRGFSAQDTAASPKVAVVNEALAHKRFPGVNPIGKRFRIDRSPKSDLYQIVGICADSRYSRLRDEPPAQFFLPYLQMPDAGSMVYELRTPMEPSALVPVLRRIVQSIDPDLPIVDVRTQQEQINANMQMERAFAALTSGFGVLALSLACVGIYGVMAYSVAQRTNEIGIRMALGARPAQVRGMVLRESTWISSAGVAGGLGAALLLARVVRSMLFGIEPWDPVTLGCGVMVLAAVAMAASWIPAQRAASIEPMQALRHE